MRIIESQIRPITDGRRLPTDPTATHLLVEFTVEHADGRRQRHDFAITLDSLALVRRAVHGAMSMGYRSVVFGPIAPEILP